MICSVQRPQISSFAHTSLILDQGMTLGLTNGLRTELMVSPLTSTSFGFDGGHAKFQVFSLEEILKHHTDICSEVVVKIRPVEHFNESIRYGSYPFYFEGKTKYYERIEAVNNQVLEGDLPSITGIDKKDRHLPGYPAKIS